MKTTEKLLESLNNCKDTLYTYLKNRNIDVSKNEGLKFLIPKVEKITTPATTVQYIPDFSIAGSDMSEEELQNLISLIYLTNPSTDVRGKFENIPNLKNLALKDLNITTIDQANKNTFSGTPLETLDLSDVTINTYTLFSNSTYGDQNQNYPHSNNDTLPQTLKRIIMNNSTYSHTNLYMPVLKNLEYIDGLNTVTFKEKIKSLSCIFCGNSSLKELDMSAMTLDDNCKVFYAAFKGCSNLEKLVGPKNFPIKPRNMLDMFTNCNKLPWKDIAEFINWDNIDLSNIRNDNLYVSGMFYINLYNYMTKEEHDANGGMMNDYPRTIDYIKWKDSWVEWDYRMFSGNHIKVLDFSGYNNTDIKISRGLIQLDGITLSWITSANGAYADLPSVQCDNIIFKDTTMAFSNLAQGSDYRATRYFKTPLTYHFDNTTFVLTGSANLVSLTKKRWLSDCDFSNLTLFFSEEFTQGSFSFGDIFSASKITEGATFKPPKLTGPKLPTISYFALSTKDQPFDVVDCSSIPFDNVISVAALFSQATYVDIGENLGKAYRQAQNNYNPYKFAWLRDNNVISKDHVINIFNKLYDLNLSYNVANGGTLYTQQIDLHADIISQLTPEEIAIVTNKGWTLM